MNNDDPRNIFYKHRENAYQTNEKNNTSDYSDNDQQQTNEMDKMKELMKKYEKEGGNKLVNDIIKNVIEQKAKGQLTNEQLLSFKARILPFLNNTQKQRLDELMEELLKL